jgi:hypothetical protein
MPKSNTKNIRHNTTSSKDSESFSLILPNQKPLQLLFTQKNGAEAPLVPVMGERRD